MDSYFEEYIKNYPDFPKKGINFKDIMPIFAEPEVFSKSLEKMSNFVFSVIKDKIFSGLNFKSLSSVKSYGTGLAPVKFIMDS